MAFPKAVHTVVKSVVTRKTPKVNPANLRKPAALPQRPLPPNRFRAPKGEKQVFLPNFVITLIRSPHLSPNYASFLTPLWFNKLDLKDYLYNLYGIHALSVRSYVIQQKIQPHKRGSPEHRDRRLRWYRPASHKKMTIEMPAPGTTDSANQGPFVWPQEPEDLSPWGKPNAEWIAKYMTAQAEESRSSKWPRDIKEVAKKAKDLLDDRRRELEAGRNVSVQGAVIPALRKTSDAAPSTVGVV